MQAFHVIDGLVGVSDSPGRQAPPEQHTTEPPAEDIPSASIAQALAPLPIPAPTAHTIAQSPATVDE